MTYKAPNKYLRLGFKLSVTISKGKVFVTVIYLVEVNNGNIRAMCEICSKLTIKTTERRQ